VQVEQIVLLLGVLTAVQAAAVVRLIHSQHREALVHKDLMVVLTAALREAHFLQAAVAVQEL
jgi:hypothetical protein